MNTPHLRTARNPDRRGMLLLLVLSVLTLFVLMGTLAIVIATRARDSARAFAAAAAGPTQRVALARDMANEALLLLIRGSTNSDVQAVVPESLLKDMYWTNNKPFDNEPYDGFDDKNPFLTRVTLNSDGKVIAVPRPAFQKTGSNAPLPIEVDNDGDGVADGVWLDKLLPSMTTPDGGTLGFRVSYLVLDLDGRVNVNAHGRGTGDSRGSTDPEGPADLDASALVGGTAWGLLRGGAGGQLPSSTASAAVQWRSPPRLVSQPVDGRFASGTSTKTYDQRFDLEAFRPALLSGSPAQNPFTLGELERVLRQFDSDAGTLPPRLAAILGDQAERRRLQVTTDSWETPQQRVNIKWAAPNAGVPEELAFWKMLVPIIVAAGAPLNEAEQWVANLIEFRDKDTSPTTPYPNGINGVEPTGVNMGNSDIWNLGYFLSPAQVLGVPMGTKQEILDLKSAGQPVVSLAQKYPKILEAIMIPSLFAATIAADPTREPGRINVNTCDAAVWTVLTGTIGTTGTNPYNKVDSVSPATSTLSLLTNVPLVFSDDTCDVTKINHSVANRLSNAATIRSHIFAVWITVEIKNSSAAGEPPSCHRLFAIVDRSIPVANFVEGQNTTVRDTIRLQRFLN